MREAPEQPPIVPHTRASLRQVLLRYVGIYAATWAAVLLLTWLYHR